MTLVEGALEKLFGDRCAADGSRVAENFARWYEGCELVDAVGSPQMLFHGTTVWERPDRQLGDISVFNRRASIEIVRRPAGLDAIGSWFSDNPARAQDYAGPHGAIYPVFARMLNPWRVESSDKMVEVWADYQASEVTGPEARALHKRNRVWGDPDRFVAGLIKEGYDGIIIGRAVGATGSTEFADQTAHIVFHAKQVKSVTGNSGLFDLESDDIADRHGWDVPIERERMRA